MSTKKSMFGCPDFRLGRKDCKKDDSKNSIFRTRNERQMKKSSTSMPRCCRISCNYQSNPSDRRIPPEILAQIFLASLEDDAVASDNIASDSYTGQTVLLPPILFGHVSSGWRAVAAATPRLWSDIRLQIEKPVDRGISSIVDHFSSQSQPHLLRLSMKIASKKYIGTPLSATLALSRRVESLHLYLPATYLQPLVGLSESSFSQLEDLDIRIPKDSSTSYDPEPLGSITVFCRAPLKQLKFVWPARNAFNLFSCEFAGKDCGVFSFAPAMAPCLYALF
ncbi:hypothetical protein B0H16DRAFT_1462894 [Mycena metata]|uniref:F-box domain-containing protein n=1 Tax=Mycena metata TaxID=1033252 RepID=A0AAD7IKC9_9AGAR|nr:hypothetical protein B0H16DRAFT_1462894 [Mycena metata]